MNTNEEEHRRTGADSSSNLETRCRLNKGVLLSRIHDRIVTESHGEESSCHGETEKALVHWIRSGSMENISKALAKSCVVSDLQELEGRQCDIDYPELETNNIAKQMPTTCLGRKRPPSYVDTDPNLSPFPSTVTRQRFGKTLPIVPRKICIAEISSFDAKGPTN